MSQIEVDRAFENDTSLWTKWEHDNPGWDPDEIALGFPDQEFGLEGENQGKPDKPDDGKPSESKSAGTAAAAVAVTAGLSAGMRPREKKEESPQSNGGWAREGKKKEGENTDKSRGDGHGESEDAEDTENGTKTQTGGDDMRDENEEAVIEENDTDSTADEDAEEERRPEKKPKGKGKKGGKLKQWLPLILIGGLVIVGGGLFLLYNAMTGTSQPQLRRPPTAAPVRSGMDRPTTPKPQVTRSSSEDSAIALADELARENKRHEPQTQSRPQSEAQQPRANAAPIQAQPPVRAAHTEAATDSDAQILEKLKELAATLDRIEKAVNQKRTAIEAQGTVTNDVRDSLNAMTQDLQNVTKENARLKKELEETRKALEAGNKQLAALKQAAAAQSKSGDAKPAVQNRKPEGKDNKDASKPKEGANDGKKPDNSAVREWQVLGFSGSRVVINTGKSVRSISVGETLGGVKILGIDIDSGDIKTSAGTLKYNH